MGSAGAAPYTDPILSKRGAGAAERKEGKKMRKQTFHVG